MLNKTSFADSSTKLSVIWACPNCENLSFRMVDGGFMSVLTSFRLSVSTNLVEKWPEQNPLHACSAILSSPCSTGIWYRKGNVTIEDHQRTTYED